MAETFPKFIEATAIWAVVAGAIGWLTWKEINRQPDHVDAGRPVTFAADGAHGVAEGSPIYCQGIRIGQIHQVKPVAGDDGELTIEMRGNLDTEYVGWDFSPDATLKQGALTAGITGAPIVLNYRGKAAEGEFDTPQAFRLTPPEDTGQQLGRLLAQADVITSAFTSPVAADQLPDDWPANTEPTRIALIVHNLERATLVLKEASAKLDHEMDAANDEALIAQLSGIRTNVDTLTDEASELLVTLNTATAAVDDKLTDLIGRTETERARPRRELNEVLARTDALLEEIREILPRVGDTFFGRMIIRRDEPDAGGAD